MKKKLGMITIILLIVLCSLSFGAYSVTIEEFLNDCGANGNRQMGEQFVQDLYRDMAIDPNIHAENMPGWTGDVNNPVDFSRIGEGSGNASAAPKNNDNNPSVPAVTAGTAQNKKGDSVAVDYSHDYPEITDEAKEALSYFTQDGTPNSAYLNIEVTSSENKVSNGLLNLSVKNAEDIKISFVSGDKTESEWVFHEWNSENEAAELDLTSTLVEDTESGYEGTYLLSFAQEGTLSGNDVTYKVNVGVSDNEVFVYRRDNGEYSEIYRGNTDSEGILELHPDELGEYVVSTTDIIAAQEAEAKAEEERLAKEKEEQKRLAAEEAQVPAETVEAASEPAVDPFSLDEADTKAEESEEKAVPFVIPIAAGVAVILVIGAVVIAKRRG